MYFSRPLTGGRLASPLTTEGAICFDRWGSPMTFPEPALAASSLDPAQFKAAVRRLFGGVSVITVGDGETRTGLTLTSTVPLSTDPPLILICVNRSSSSWPVIVAERRFCVNLLDAGHQAIAERGWVESKELRAMREPYGANTPLVPGVSLTPSPLSIARSRSLSSGIATQS